MALFKQIDRLVDPVDQIAVAKLARPLLRPPKVIAGGWTLQFDEYQDAGALALPRKFEVANSEIRLKVDVDTWSDLPALK